MATLLQPTNSLSVDEALRSFSSRKENPFRVQILRPSVTAPKSTMIVPLAMPLGPAYLAGILEAAGYDVDLIDGIGEDADRIAPVEGTQDLQYGASDDHILERIRPDTAVLGISLMFTSQWLSDRALIRKIRARYPDLTIVVGGEHASALPEYVLRDVEIDYVICGEGELAFLELVHSLTQEGPDGHHAGKVKGVHYLSPDKEYISNGLSSRVRDFQNLPRPAWHLVPVQNYQRSPRSHGIDRGFSVPMLVSRGCPFQCTFCSSPTMWTTRYLLRDAKNVADEVQEWIRKYDIKGVFLCDLTAFTRKTWILQFCAELKARNISMAWQLPAGTRSEALDEETLKALYEINCRDLTYAPESGSAATLEQVKKKVSLAKLENSVRTALRLGFSVKVNMIIGFPEESRREMYKTLVFCLKMAILGVHDCYPQIFSPYPGSEIYRDLVNQAKLPAPNEDYFLSLRSISDSFWGGVSYASIPLWELNFYRLATTLAFFVFSYLLHPKRLFRSFSIFSGKKFRASSYFEQRLYEFAIRSRTVSP